MTKNKRITSAKFYFTGIDLYSNDDVSDFAVEVTNLEKTLENLDKAVSELVEYLNTWDEDPMIIDIYAIDVTFEDGTSNEMITANDSVELKRLTALAKKLQ